MSRQIETDKTKLPNLPEAIPERRACMFCLEEEFGRKKYITIWYSQLYPCECRFASHWQCLTKWQVACHDELQCPICKVFSRDPYLESLSTETSPQEEPMPDTSRIYFPTETGTKMRYCMLIYFFFIVWMFLYGYMKLFVI